jgi:chromosome segregation ATPase
MLFKVKERVYEKALEIGVGAKLHNIVVENEQLGKFLAENETFGKVVSLIPNNKIQYN